MLIEFNDKDNEVNQCGFATGGDGVAIPEKVIGIIGGMGPMAGLDLAQKILDQTIAVKDQDHLPVVLMSMPDRINDRSLYLLGEEKNNPAYSIADIIEKIHQVGANTIGIACNTSHSPEIYNQILKSIALKNIKVKIFHIIDEVVLFIAGNFLKETKIGVLSTRGLYRINGYAAPLIERGFEVILPDDIVNRDYIHRAIYDPEFGIKSKFSPVTPQAIEWLQFSMDHLKEKGAQVVILGCTELSLAIKDQVYNGVMLVDPATILARALIKEIDESKLKEYRYL